MLSSIGLVLSVEMIRDGGSLAAVFQGSNGHKYWWEGSVISGLRPITPLLCERPFVRHT